MKKLVYVLGVLLLGAGIWALTRSDAKIPDIVEAAPLRIHQGTVIGALDTSNPEIQVFNGIPYASSKRWAAPTSPPQWGATPRKAIDFGARCMQSETRVARYQDMLAERRGLNGFQRVVRKWRVSEKTFPAVSETCLFLNVRSANVGQNTLKPVMVWIHGGSHQFGAGSHPNYQSNAIVEKGAVLITINYRLGPFGYLAHPVLTEVAGTSGNYGLLDQIAALEWIRDNAAFFGGDPKNVTLFGESAGAQSITELMASPLADGLYHKGILQSGASTSLTLRRDSPTPFSELTAEAIGEAFLSDLVPATATAEDLRAIPAHTLVALSETRPDLSAHFLPIIDGQVVPEMIAKRIRDGDAPRIPMIVGFNADEGTIFYDRILSPTRLHPPIHGSFDDHEAALESVYGHNSARALAALYGMQTPEGWHEGAEDMLGDEMFGGPSRFMARNTSRAGQPSWAYIFTRPVPGSRQTLGAHHAAEILFVMNTHEPGQKLSKSDRILTDAMTAYWVNFATHGTPNGDGLPTWPGYDQTSDVWLELGKEIKPAPAYRARKLSILEDFIDRRIDTMYPPVKSTPVDPATLTDAVDTAPASGGE